MAARVCVIGGGPAGLTAALRAAESGARTVLLEQEERVGKKLLLTGNGHCNFTNRSMGPAFYHQEEGGFADRALQLFGEADTETWFRSLGIWPQEKHGGYLYPRSGQAGSVLNALRDACQRAGVRTVTACITRQVLKKKSGLFQIRTQNEMVPADALVLATGSPAGRGKNQEESGTVFAKEFGHRVVPMLPALCGFSCAEKEFFKAAAGVRTPGRVTLLLEGRPEESAEGEVQLTAYGISGIPAFQVSRTVARALQQGRKAAAVLNLLPEFEDPKEFLTQRIREGQFATLEALGNGLVNRNLWGAVLRLGNLRPGAVPGDLSDEELNRLSDAVSGAVFRIIRVNGFDQAQTCTGGVALGEISPETMESRLVPGLFFAGEMMDVDGLCGGYNLQWCWTSGTLAGRSAARILDGPGQT